MTTKGITERLKDMRSKEGKVRLLIRQDAGKGTIIVRAREVGRGIPLREEERGWVCKCHNNYNM